MARTDLWFRLKQWFRTRLGKTHDDGGLRPNAEDGPVPALTSDSVDDADPVTDRAVTLSRWSRRETTLSRLQDGYDRLLELMDAIHKHMQAQQDRTEQIATGITQLSRSMADFPGASQQQIQLLSAIAAQLETTTVRTQQLSDAVGELPRVVRTQTEALSGVQRQLEMASESDAHLSTSLQSFERSVGKLGESSEHQAAAMRDLRASSDEHQRRLGEIIERQTHRFVVMLIIVAVLAGAGIVVGTVALVMRLLR
jgi:chromosome segregation ATPase